MTDPFAGHAIDHLSPSSCALWSSAPAMWVMQYLLKKKRHVGPAAYRGTAVESGVGLGLSTDASLATSKALAIAEYDGMTALNGDASRDKERAGIPGMVELALGELRPYGTPSARQGKVELAVDGLAVPIIGYYDFLWQQHGVLTDLKTLHALPSSIRTQHARQAAFYSAASGLGNCDARITYVTSRRVATYRVEEPARHVEALRLMSLSIQRFVALSADPMVLARLVAPDFDSFYWSDPQTRQDGFEIWGY